MQYKMIIDASIVKNDADAIRYGIITFRFVLNYIKYRNH